MMTTSEDRNHVQVCRGTACHVKGSAAILDAVKRELKVEPGQTTRGGSVDVTLACHASQAIIAVADTGIGIASEELGRIFDEFARIKNEQTNHIPGSGLGLSIVKKLVQLYDGDVKVESQPHVGTTFTVVLNH